MKTLQINFSPQLKNVGEQSGLTLIAPALDALRRARDPQVAEKDPLKANDQRLWAALEDCLAALRNHDLVGVHWRDKPFPHFSGNFWWARNEYLRRLEQSIHDAVRDFEPRVDLIDVRAEPDVSEPGQVPEAVSAGRAEARVMVSIDYKVRRTNSRFNLVFPFYLGTVEIA